MDRVFDDACHPVDDSGFGAYSAQSHLDATSIKVATKSRKLAIAQAGGGIPGMLDTLSRADLAYADLPSAHLIWQNKFGTIYSRYPGVDVNETFGGKTLLQLFEQIHVAALSASESKLVECISLSQILSGTDLDVWLEEQGARLPAHVSLSSFEPITA
ncbi:hypothetical protein DL96DRAFT_1580951 [Flagelloscypha sp. PMI_526]|nr:hypothetical protein DL96DRAFT_1580951 [Flagelloscypha sp. PMI_526]